MDFPDQTPTELRNFFEENYPPLINIEKLDGMSGSGVWRAVFGNKKVVLKRSPKPLESDFYKIIAPSLRQQGVAIPELYWQGAAEDGSYWLALESIPTSLPRERWSADPQVLAILGNLHRAMFSPGFDLARGKLFRPVWNDAMSENAVKMLHLDSLQLAPVLRNWQEKAQQLFEPTHPISADPNPANWGLREDGSPVLFDWERFTFGSPAIDVAIIMTGLPDKEQFRYNATKYFEINPDVVRQSLDEFAEDVKIAKVWTTIEFSYDYATNPDNGIPEETIQWLREKMPDWLASLV